MFGPAHPLLGPHVQSICDAVDVPHLEARPDSSGGSAGFSVNLRPGHAELARAYGDLIGFLNWSRLAVVYEDNDGKLLVGVTPNGSRFNVTQHLKVRWRLM